MPAVAALLAVLGCALEKNGNRPGNVFNRVGGHGGHIIEPKRCVLRVAILSRPFGDPAINEAVWRVADEQAISPRDRRAWEVNGLRVGRIIGEPPPELEAILRESAPQKKVNPTSFIVESGEQTLISISDPVEQASLLLNRDNRVYGKPYGAASGFFRVTAQHDGAQGVSLRLVPEIHHGPIVRTWQPLPNPTPLVPQELRIHDGQREEILRDLPATLVLEPGQIAVIGCRPEHQRSLGSFLFAQDQAHSDQRHQKLILIWASRNRQGLIENEAKTSDRPKLSNRLFQPAPSPASPKPAIPAPVPEMPRSDTSTPVTDSASTNATTAKRAGVGSGGSPRQGNSTAPAPSNPPATEKSGQTP
jgi:hypothetical protein